MTGLTGNNAITGAGYRKNQPPYEIDQSLRFNDDDSAYLSRTPSSAGNRKTWTWSGWFKMGIVDGSYRTILGSGGGTSRDRIQIFADEQLVVNFNDGADANLNTTQVFRDPAAWYHLVVAVDTTQATSTDRIKIYVNGEQISAFDTANYPTQDYDTHINNTDTQYIGQSSANSFYWDGYLAEVHLIDGQALTPASFGETNNNNQFVPIEYVGSYGTNGFYLPFSGTQDGYTKLLMHMDGSNGGTTFTDSSSVGASITAYGDAQTDTSVKKIGTASAKFDGTGDYVFIPSSSEYDFTGSSNGTIECWVRFNTAASSTHEAIVSGGYGSSNARTWELARLTTGEAQLRVFRNTSPWDKKVQGTTNLAADTWYHLAGVRQGDNIRIYVNGVQEGVTSGMNSYSGWNTGRDFYLGDEGPTTGNNLNGYIDELRFSSNTRYPDGTTFTPRTTEYGDVSIGADSSGNNNDFTPTNLAATDQVLDSPTNNFCTLNPLNLVTNTTLSEGNLKADCTSSNDGAALGTMSVSSGKWYWEVLQTTANANNDISMGVMELSRKMAPQGVGADVYPNAYLYGNDGWNAKYNSTTSTINTYGAGDIIGWALDLDGNTLKIYKNNSLEYTYSSGVSGTFTPLAAVDGTSGQSVTHIANFGQDSSFNGEKTAQGNGGDGEDFYYTPPTGFKALNTDNLSDPSIADPTAYFNTLLYTADGTAGRSITGVGFAPDFVWAKERNAVAHHVLVDSVRGTSSGGRLSSNRTNAEDATGGVAIGSFDSDGFTVGSSAGYLNSSTTNYVAWNWKAGGTASTNEDGSITSSVSANTDAGFSIVAWTGTGSNVTVGHGLSQAPELIINKSRGDAYNWAVQSFLWNSASDTNLLYLNTTAAEADDTNVFQAAPTSTVFSPQGGSWAGIGANTIQYIAYCFHSVEGYSKVGSYTGNGSSDGVFIYTGFRPAWFMCKRNSSTNQWTMADSIRSPYNVADDILYANLSDVETTSDAIYFDFVSNGIKLRSGTAGNVNTSGSSYIYLAFAESPFKTSNAR